MLPKEYLEVGIIKKPFGNKGLLRAVVFDQYIHLIQPGIFVFLKHDGIHIPYLVEHFVINKHIELKLDDVQDSVEAEKLKAFTIYLATDSVQLSAKTEKKNLQYAYLQNYHVYVQKKNIGIIKEVLEFPEQEMAIISGKDADKMIPLNDVFITSIDRKNKNLYLNLPEGLLDAM